MTKVGLGLKEGDPKWLLYPLGKGIRVHVVQRAIISKFLKRAHVDSKFQAQLNKKCFENFQKDGSKLRIKTRSFDKIRNKTRGERGNPKHVILIHK